ncbi:hypothetical protein [Mixta intestinalis]|uniref:Uncharacterized protein n=1 Tax=Mixta intestinalis TaxID=1615494 RepID=A0A6P1Q502_9GAMM|nr:hypothetical protein [Mixta intestinalis]QHM73472.1 hypothetical protein C7M51_03819 [Mixta intestinalis]
MKTKFMLSVLAGLVVSASAMASAPASYDTKFNVSANVPDSVKITDPDGRPVTEVDVVLEAAPSGKMEAEVRDLKLWSNNVADTAVQLVMDDAGVATGDAFTLVNTDGGTMKSMTYKINTVIEGADAQYFNNSGDSNDYTLTVNGTHAELPVAFQFTSIDNYDTLGQGLYTGVVYANVVANP